MFCFHHLCAHRPVLESPSQDGSQSSDRPAFWPLVQPNSSTKVAPKACGMGSWAYWLEPWHTQGLAHACRATQPTHGAALKPKATPPTCTHPQVG